MDKVRKVVDSIIDELDGRKGFEFGDIDEDILQEIKDELVKLILPVVSTTVNCDNCDTDNSAKYCEKCYIQADEGIGY